MKGGEQQQLNLPAGFRFHPTDDELVVHYLCRKCAGQPISVPIVAEIDLYKFDPWQLPGMINSLFQFRKKLFLGFQKIEISPKSKGLD